MVDQQLIAMEQSDHVMASSSVYNRNRCVYSGLGSLLSGRGNWRLLEHGSVFSGG